MAVTLHVSCNAYVNVVLLQLRCHYWTSVRLWELCSVAPSYFCWSYYSSFSFSADVISTFVAAVWHRMVDDCRLSQMWHCTARLRHFCLLLAAEMVFRVWILVGQRWLATRCVDSRRRRLMICRRLMTVSWRVSTTLPCADGETET